MISSLSIDPDGEKNICSQFLKHWIDWIIQLTFKFRSVESHLFICFGISKKSAEMELFYTSDNRCGVS